MFNISSKTRFLLVAMLLCIQQLSAQSPIPIKLPTIAPLSPEGAAVARYVDYPVDYSRGLVNISIPLYEIKVGDLTLPISLSYHGAGIKPREDFGWVGAGWTLNAEPSVVRQIVGNPDEQSTVDIGYMHNDYHNELQLTYGADYLRQLATGVTEETPDNYYYKLLSEGGSFYLNSYYDDIYSHSSYHGYVPQPFSPMTINYVGGSASSFNIRDKNGVYYVFGGADRCEYAWNSNGIATRWLCDYVQGSTTNARIDFTYGSSIMLNTPEVTNEQIIVEDQGGQAYLTDIYNNITTKYVIGLDGQLTPEYDGPTYNISTSRLSYTSIEERKIQQISFGQGRVVFVASGNKLDKIQVFDALDNLIKEVIFHVTPYHSSTDIQKLDKIEIKGQNTDPLTYTFEYEDIVHVPSRFTKGIDHWGFYNGANSNSSLIPYTSVDIGWSITNTQTQISIGHANRESSFPEMQTGVLKSITSPEGSKTTFIYGPNKYGWVNNPNDISTHIMGGLRIEQVVVRDALVASTGYIRSFQYGEPFRVEIGSQLVDGDWGIPKTHVSGNDYAYSRVKIVPNMGTNYNTRMRFYSSYPLRSIGYNNGSSVLYRVVTEKMVPQDNITKETMIKRRFRVPDKQPWSTIPSMYWSDPPTTPMPKSEITDVSTNTDQKGDFVWGQLVEEEIYKNTGAANDMNDNAYSLVQKKEYNWSLHKGSVGSYTYYAEQGFSGYNYPCVNGVIWNAVAYDRNVVESNYYYVQSSHEDLRYVGWSLQNGNMKADAETVTTYDGAASVSVKKEYTYDDNSLHMQPVKVITTNSDGTLFTEHFSYPEDLIVNASTISNPEDLGQEYLLQTNRLLNLLETRDEKGGIVKTSRMKFNGPRPELAKTKGAQATAFENRIRYHRYDGYGNAAEVSLEGGVKTCFLWSYNNQHPVAKIENITYTQLVTVLSQTFIDDLRAKFQPSQQDLQTINNLRSQLMGAFVNTYTYKPLVGLSTITDPNGRTTYYEYDGLGRLQLVKDKDQNVVKKYEYHSGN